MSIIPYLRFRGDCEEAFLFYAKAFECAAPDFIRASDLGYASAVPRGREDWLVHASLRFQGGVIYGYDIIFDEKEMGTGAGIVVNFDDRELAERVFNRLVKGGRMMFPFHRTERTDGVGSTYDRYGARWLIAYEGESDFLIEDDQPGISG